MRNISPYCSKSILRSMILFSLSALISCAGIDRGADDSQEKYIVSENHATLLKRKLSSPKDGDVMVVAHRACWGMAPENSLRAIEDCICMGVDMVEVDVRQTKDGQLVLMHDSTIDRTTNGSGLVSDLTLAEIGRFHLKEGTGGETAKLTDYQVPTLQQALVVARNRILVNLDVKARLRDESYRVARDLGVSDHILIKMGLSSLEDINPEETAFFGNTFFMPIVQQQSGELSKQIASLESFAPVAFEVIYQTEDQLSDACKVAASQKSRCWVSTTSESLSPGHSDYVSVQDPDIHWGYLVKLGVNMFQTDRPQQLIDYLSSRGLRKFSNYPAPAICEEPGSSRAKQEQ